MTSNNTAMAKPSRHLRHAGLAVGLLAGVLVTGPVAPASGDAGSAVVLLYHRFGVSASPSTNIRLDQFEGHLETLESGGYTVLPVPEIVARLKGGENLPELTVGITIDDAHKSVYHQAWPRLREAGFPFTLFVSTDSLDAGYGETMSWEQVRELARSGVTIGNHGAAHDHMTSLGIAENMDKIAKASRRISEETGRPSELFAYPYGEFDTNLRRRVAEAGFAAAFGQHSGVVHGGSDFHALPRFSLNQRFGDLPRFRLVTRTLPLPVEEVTPSDPVLTVNPPQLGFTVSRELENLSALRCYASGRGEMAIERLGERRYEMRLAKPLPPGRARINCTLPAANGRWRWHGVQFLVPKP